MSLPAPHNFETAQPPPSGRNTDPPKIRMFRIKENVGIPAGPPPPTEPSTLQSDVENYTGLTLYIHRCHLLSGTLFEGQDNYYVLGYRKMTQGIIFAFQPINRPMIQVPGQPGGVTADWVMMTPPLPKPGARYSVLQVYDADGNLSFGPVRFMSNVAPGTILP